MFDEMSEKFDTLVLSGGAVKGYTILGSVQALIDKNMFDNITNFYGTSVGAIIGYLLAIGYSPIEITVFLHVEKITENLRNFNINMMSMGEGAISFDIISSTLEKMTLQKIGKILTLDGLKKEYKKRLVCCTYNMTTCKTEYLTPENFPDIPCLIALRMSANIPIIFPRFKYMENYYIDGGISDNFPIMNAYQGESKNIVGIYVDISEQSMKDEPSEGMVSYLLKLLQIPLIQSTKFKIENIEKELEKKENKEKSVKIIRVITKDLKSAVDFHVDVKTGLDMFSQGYNSVKRYFGE